MVMCTLKAYFEYVEGVETDLDADRTGEGDQPDGETVLHLLVETLLRCLDIFSYHCHLYCDISTYVFITLHTIIRYYTKLVSSK